MPSRGDEESGELQLVAVRNGIELRSRAKESRGGSLLAWFGGVNVDLREVELAPDARLSVHALFGGVGVKVPRGWRVVSTAKALSGGVEVRSAAGDVTDAPVLTVDGLAVFGGIVILGLEGSPVAA